MLTGGTARSEPLSLTPTFFQLWKGRTDLSLQSTNTVGPSLEVTGDRRRTRQPWPYCVLFVFASVWAWQHGRHSTWIMHLVCVHYLKGRHGQFATLSVTIAKTSGLTFRQGNAHPEAIPTTPVRTRSTFKQGMGYTFKRIKKNHLHLILWYRREDRKTLQGVAIHLLPSGFLFIFF